MTVCVEMHDMDETSTSVINPSLLDTPQSQQPVVMTSLPRKLNNGDARVSYHTEAATSCEEILMTVHTNKGFLSDSILALGCLRNYIKYQEKL